MGVSETSLVRFDAGKRAPVAVGRARRLAKLYQSILETYFDENARPVLEEVRVRHEGNLPSSARVVLDQDDRPSILVGGSHRVNDGRRLREALIHEALHVCWAWPDLVDQKSFCIARDRFLRTPLWSCQRFLNLPFHMCRTIRKEHLYSREVLDSGMEDYSFIGTALAMSGTWGVQTRWVRVPLSLSIHYVGILSQRPMGYRLVR